MIDLHQFDPKSVLTAGIWIGVFSGGFVGFLTAAIFGNRRSRKEYIRGSADTEKLIRNRILRDLRDDSPICKGQPR